MGRRVLPFFQTINTNAMKNATKQTDWKRTRAHRNAKAYVDSEAWLVKDGDRIRVTITDVWVREGLVGAVRYDMVDDHGNSYYRFPERDLLFDYLVAYVNGEYKRVIANSSISAHLIAKAKSPYIPFEVSKVW